MTSRRGDRSHVRPRPPSSGRPRQAVRVPAPASHRVRPHRGVQGRRRGLPILSQAVLTLSILALGAVVFLTAGGAIGPLVASLGNTLQGAVGKLVASQQPSPSIVVATDAPIIAAPDHPLTNQATANLAITVPVAVIGTDAKVRVYVALSGLTPAPVREAQIGSTAQVNVTVQLTKGPNTFTATIVRNGAESPPSDPQTITLDQDPPKIAVTSPKNGATVTGATVTLTGTTQAQSQLVAQNAANGSSISGLADPITGAFSLTLPIDSGANQISIQATDPAGNVATASITVNQGTGKLKASLSASLYRISVSHPPGSLQLRVTVTDPNGAPLPDASAFFTLQIPGLAPISATINTDTNGRASFTTELVGPMTIGNGLATVLVTSSNFGTVTDRVNLIFVK